jgi:hypothetical protein
MVLEKKHSLQKISLQGVFLCTAIDQYSLYHPLSGGVKPLMKPGLSVHVSIIALPLFFG